VFEILAELAEGIIAMQVSGLQFQRGTRIKTKGDTHLCIVEVFRRLIFRVHSLLIREDSEAIEKPIGFSIYHDSRIFSGMSHNVADVGALNSNQFVRLSVLIQTRSGLVETHFKTESLQRLPR